MKSKKKTNKTKARRERERKKTHKIRNDTPNCISKHKTESHITMPTYANGIQNYNLLLESN